MPPYRLPGHRCWREPPRYMQMLHPLTCQASACYRLDLPCRWQRLDQYSQKLGCQPLNHPHGRLRGRRSVPVAPTPSPGPSRPHRTIIKATKSRSTSPTGRRDSSPPPLIPQYCTPHVFAVCGSTFLEWPPKYMKFQFNSVQFSCGWASCPR